MKLSQGISGTAAIFLVVSGIVGSGVFKKIASMAEILHAPMLILLCWAVAGLLSLAGALCSAELASMMPGSGGEFGYFKKIYGRYFAFIFGWSNLTVMKTATLAALAYIFSQSFNSLIPLPNPGLSIKFLASFLLVFLSFVNYRGVTFSAGMSRYLLAAIILAMLGFVCLAAGSEKGSIDNLTASELQPKGWNLFSAFFAASLSAFWGYEGWNTIGFIGEEIKNPQKNLPKALVMGTLFVMLLYLLVNAAYLWVLPINELSAINHHPDSIAAVEIARYLMGPVGAVTLSVIILLSTFNCTNSTILTSSRVLYAMSSEGIFLESTAKIHPHYKTPSNAIILQCIWALVLLWMGTFDQLTDLLVFAAFIFYGATALGQILMRIKYPNTERPYKLKLYPYLPLIFVLFCLILVVMTIFNSPLSSFVGLLLVFSGTPVYWYRQQKKKVKSALDVQIKEKQDD